jgi:hypothetical protein
MLEKLQIWLGPVGSVAGAAGLAFGLAACAVPEPVKAPEPVVVAPEPPTAPPPVDPAAAAEEAKALLAQAETDVQRARTRRALWQKAWESLLAARAAASARDDAATARHARRASELAQLGLEQLAYPAVK